MLVYIKTDTGELLKRDSLDGVSFDKCRLLWVDLLKPTEEDLASITEYFEFHPVAIDSCRQSVHEPGVHEFPGHLSVTWNFLRDDPETDKLEFATLVIFLGANFLVTVHHSEMPELEAIQAKLADGAAFHRDRPAPLLYSILDNAVDEYFPLVEGLTEQIDTLMEDMLSDDETGELKDILYLKHRNMAMRRIAVTHRDVIMKLARRDVPYIPEELSIYLLDVYDHLVRIGSEVDNNSDLIAASLDVHLNTVSNRLNVTMKRLTTVATIFLPLTFIVGLYGMNFENMPEIHWQYGYLVVWGVMIAVAVVMVIIARKKDWL